MIILGVIFIVVGIVMLLNYFNSKKRLEEMSAAEASSAAFLHEICQGVASEMGKGSFEQKATVKGVIECDQPLESEVAKQACVHYRMSVEREWEEDYEETYTEKDPDTEEEIQKTRQATRKGSDTVSSNTRSTKFHVRDETGAILVDPEGAQIDTEQVADRFEPHTSSGGTISFGGFSMSIGDTANEGRRRTLGYHFREWLLPLNRPVYVLGSASDMSGELMIQKPREKGKFIISLKSEEELATSAKSGMTWGLYGSIACFAVGIIFVILHFM